MADSVFNCGTNYRVEKASTTKVAVPEYSTFSPENSDGTRAVFYAPHTSGGGGWVLYDTSVTPPTFIKALNPTCADATRHSTIGPDRGMRWSGSATGTSCANQADTLYFVCGSALKTYCASNDAQAIVHDFDAVMNAATSYITTEDEGNPSDDTCKWVLNSDASGGQNFKYDVIGYDACTNTILWQTDINTLSNGVKANNTNGYDKATVGPRGTTFVAAWNDNQYPPRQGSGANSYNMATGALISTMAGGGGHGDMVKGTSADFYCWSGHAVSGDPKANPFRTISCINTSDGTENDVVLPSPWNSVLNCCFHLNGSGSRGSAGTANKFLLSHYTPGSRLTTPTSFGDDEMVVADFSDGSWIRIGQQWNANASGGDNTCSVGHGGYDCSYWGQTKAVASSGYVHVYWGTTWLNTANEPHLYMKVVGAGCTTAPGVTITSPTSTTYTSVPVSISVTGSSNCSGVSISTIVVKDQNSNTVCSSSGSTSCSANWSPTNATYTLTATVTDALGNVGTGSVSNVVINVPSRVLINGTMTINGAITIN